MNKNITIAFLLAVTLGLVSAFFYIATKQERKLTRVTIVGDAQERLAPDTAVIRFSVFTQNSQALVAQQENAKKSEAVKNALEQITQNLKTEIKTSDYSLNPEQSYNYGKMPKIVGYEVKNTVTISVNDLNKVGEIIDAATKAGANSVEGISFVLDESNPAQGSALSLATEKARAKAEAMAKALNGRVVRIIDLREGNAPILPPNYPQDSLYSANTTSNSAAEARSYATPIQAGDLKVDAQVVLIAEIESE